MSFESSPENELPLKEEETRGKERTILTPRPFDMYINTFGIDPETFRGKKILDVGSGLSDFSKAVNERYGDSGTFAVAIDPLYKEFDGDFTAFKEYLQENNIQFEPRGMKINPVDPDFRVKRRYQELQQAPGKVAGSHQMLPFGENSFDLILANNSFSQLNQREVSVQAISEIVRALNEHGEFRVVPSNIFYDKGRKSFFVGRFPVGKPSKEQTEDAEKEQVPLPPDREFFSEWKNLEEQGCKIYLLPIPSEHRNRLPLVMGGKTLVNERPPFNGLIIRKDDQIPHTTNSVVLKLSFADSPDGYHVSAVQAKREEVPPSM